MDSLLIIEQFPEFTAKRQGSCLCVIVTKSDAEYLFNFFTTAFKKYKSLELKSSKLKKVSFHSKPFHQSHYIHEYTE